MKTILVIDDDPDARLLLERLLTTQGYSVRLAPDREEALKQLSLYQPSIILLDVLLSGVDGRQVCREIRDRKEYENLPIIMISAHPGATENYRSYGATDFITKPIRSDALLKVITNLFPEN